MLFTQGQRNFFRDVFNFDVTEVRVVEYMEDSKVAGFYNENNPGIININSKYKGDSVAFNTTLIHEVTHLLQYEHRASISLPLGEVFYDDVVFTAELVDSRSNFLDWANRPLEIDAIFTEAYYVWYLNHDVEGIEDTIVGYLKSRLKNTTDVGLLKDLMSRIKDNSFSQIVKGVIE